MIGIGVLTLAPALLAACTPVLRKFGSKDRMGWLLTSLVALLFFWLLSYLSPITELGFLEFSIPWVPSLGLNLSIYLDGLALIFGLIILGIGAVILLYAAYYFDDLHELSRFYGLLLAFMSAMLSVVLAGNVLTLFIAWELTSILSFLLIGFYGKREDARGGALQALIITAGGGLALLVGLVLMGTASGSMELSQIISDTTLRENPWYSAFTILILIGCFSKSAQFPLHFWLPGAMNAPTPASAYLHSATMVKAGIYLMLRLSPTLGDTSLWQDTLMAGGLLTMLIGAAFALRQRDLKAALAYSTISQLGVLTALVGLPHGEGVKAALLGILAHSLYKATLFLVAGAVDHATRTRLLDKLGGLASHLPGWTVVAVLAGLSMAGLPPLLGFVAKESLLEVMLESPVALAVVVISAAFTGAMSFILVWDVFWGDRSKQYHLHLSSRAMAFGPAVLGFGSLLTGLMLEPLVAPLISPAVGYELHLSLFHGINTPLILSTVAIIAGLAIFATRQLWRAWAIPALPTGSQVFQRIVRGVERAGDVLLRTQAGKLRYYLLVILGSVTVLQATAGLTHLQIENLQLQFNGSIDVLRTLLLLLSLAAILVSILYRSHLVAALAMGVSGYSVGGIFLIEPAPDVALVQFMVETLGTVLLVVMLARIRAEERQKAMDELWGNSRLGLARDIFISVAIGVGVSVFALAAVSSRPTSTTIASWHIENAVVETGINDVVGAIVTDFRGMDTFVEITVFTVAALGVLTIIARPVRVSAITGDAFHRFKRLVRRRANMDEAVEEAVEGIPADGYQENSLLNSSFSTPLTRVMAQLVLPFSMIVALSHLLYGGDAPGDGFTAGIISGLGVALWYIVFGYHESRERLKWLNTRGLIGLGLTLALGMAVFPLFIGQSFFSHIAFDQVKLPADLHLSSSLVYETGIFLTVLGSVSMMMEAIAYPKEVEPL